MTDNVIRFPGYLDLGNGYGQGAKGYWHGCKHFENFKAMANDLSEIDLERTRQWHVKREGRGDYKAGVVGTAMGSKVVGGGWGYQHYPGPLSRLGGALDRRIFYCDVLLRTLAAEGRGRASKVSYSSMLPLPPGGAPRGVRGH